MRKDYVALIDRLSLEEKILLLSGQDSWTVAGIPRLHIPSLRVTDGPNGARGGGSLVNGTRAACFPAAIALASSWNLALLEEVGQALALEAMSKNAQVLLAPTINLHRSVQNGRNFECFSEDPLLSASLAEAYITGLQSFGIAATVKHYLGNESEYQRFSINSVIDERSLREVYLLPFEAAVRKADVWALMTAYNKINGVFASENKVTLHKILREEWGFQGVTMSDWFGSHSTAPTVNAGLDLEMPGPTRDRGQKLVKAVEQGEVLVETITQSAERLLRLLDHVAVALNTVKASETALARPETSALIRRAGAEGMVLLKNHNHLLPLQATRLKKIAVIGPNAAVAQIMGGGSAQLLPHYAISPLEGLKTALGPGVEVVHALGCENNRFCPLLAVEFRAEFYANREFNGPVIKQGHYSDSQAMWLDYEAEGLSVDGFSVRLSADFTPEKTGVYQFGLFSAGRSRLFIDDAMLISQWDDWQAGENFFTYGSEETRASLALTAGESVKIRIEVASAHTGNLRFTAVRVGGYLPASDADLEAAVLLAASADVVIACTGRNGEWDGEGRDIPSLNLPGRQDELMFRLCAANPCVIAVLQTGGPVLLPWLSNVQAVLQAWYPGQECGHSLADVLLGTSEPSGRLPQTWPQRLEDNPAHGNYPGHEGEVCYQEGVFMGYRHYAQKNLSPLFPFGHGLGYTDFHLGNLTLSKTTLQPDDIFEAVVAVTNTGRRGGSCVVQFYISDDEASVARPQKELRGFGKCYLEVGETKNLTMRVTMRDLAFYDVTHQGWLAEAGSYVLEAAVSAITPGVVARFNLETDWRATAGEQRSLWQGPFERAL